jgi:hypothetical protein
LSSWQVFSVDSETAFSSWAGRLLGTQLLMLSRFSTLSSFRDFSNMEHA